MQSLDTNTNDILAIKLDELIAATLNNTLKPKVSIARTLWTTTDISEYLRLSYKYVHEHVVSHHTFPHPVRLKFKNEKKGHPRWYAGEVIEWVAGFQEN